MTILTKIQNNINFSITEKKRAVNLTDLVSYRQLLMAQAIGKRNLKKQVDNFLQELELTSFDATYFNEVVRPIKGELVILKKNLGRLNYQFWRVQENDTHRAAEAFALAEIDIIALN